MAFPELDMNSASDRLTGFRRFVQNLVVGRTINEGSDIAVIARDYERAQEAEKRGDAKAAQEYRDHARSVIELDAYVAGHPGSPESEIISRYTRPTPPGPTYEEKVEAERKWRAEERSNHRNHPHPEQPAQGGSGIFGALRNAFKGKEEATKSQESPQNSDPNGYRFLKGNGGHAPATPLPTKKTYKVFIQDSGNGNAIKEFALVQDARDATDKFRNNLFQGANIAHGVTAESGQLPSQTFDGSAVPTSGRGYTPT